MTKEKMEELLKAAAKKYCEKAKQAKRPETQFIAGAHWLWDLLMSAKDIVYYENLLRQEIIGRTGEVEIWQESLITDTAKMMADRDGMEDDIRESGRLLEKWDKNMNPYKESNPLYVHLKELQRSIGMQREHLGLSFKVNPKRITEPTKKGLSENDILANTLAAARDDMNDPKGFMMPE